MHTQGCLGFRVQRCLIIGALGTGFGAELSVYDCCRDSRVKPKPKP